MFLAMLLPKKITESKMDKKRLVIDDAWGIVA